MAAAVQITWDDLTFLERRRACTTLREALRHTEESMRSGYLIGENGDMENAKLAVDMLEQACEQNRYR